MYQTLIKKARQKGNIDEMAALYNKRAKMTLNRQFLIAGNSMEACDFGPFVTQQDAEFYCLKWGKPFSSIRSIGNAKM